jgi:hypothetical protein
LLWRIIRNKRTFQVAMHVSLPKPLSARRPLLLLAGTRFVNPVLGMRICFIILGLWVLGGCSAKPAQRANIDRPGYVDSSAASLAFSPPVAQGEAPVFLPRDQRQPGVFIGFEDVSASYFYIRTDDRMTNDGTDHYVRRAIIEKVGVSYR